MLDVSIISQESWDPNWSLQEVSTQFVGIPSKIKQSIKYIKCIEPKEQIGMLKPYMADTAMNLWGRDLLQQW